MIKSKAFTVNPFQENAYVIYSHSKICIIIDPGFCNVSEKADFISFIAENGLEPKEIWLTHAHIDHVLGLKFCCDHFGIKALLHPLEVPQLKAVEVYAPNYGFYDFEPTDKLEVMDVSQPLSIAEESFEVLFVPGHSPGHVAFYHSKSGQIWAGDVLFQQSVGRTDLPGGNFQTLEQSIQNQLYSLPSDTVVFPGHGPSTTIEHEQNFNPFVRPKSN